MPFRKHILCIGDSITVGIVAGGGTPYVDQLRKLLGWRYKVTNAGSNGTTSHDWSHPGVDGFPDVFGGCYEKHALPNLPCHTAVVLLGGNDAVGFWEPRPISIDNYFLNMKTIRDRLLEDGAERVVFITPVITLAAGEGVLNLISNYVFQLSLLANNKVRVFDVYSKMSMGLDFVEGNVHPNEHGHSIIAKEVYEAIRFDEIVANKTEGVMPKANVLFRSSGPLGQALVEIIILESPHTGDVVHTRLQNAQHVLICSTGENMQCWNLAATLEGKVITIAGNKHLDNHNLGLIIIGF